VGQEIREGIVLCVKTPYYEIGWGSMMVEDMIVVRATGRECLTRLPQELQRL
jgi:Xaa-Pro aminopeptidase